MRFGFGAGVDKALHDPFEARFGFPLIEAWAMTETGAGAVVVASREPRHTGTSCFGRLGPELEARIVADGGAEADVDEPGELAGPPCRCRAALRLLPRISQGRRGHRGSLGWRLVSYRRRGAARPDGALHFVDRKKNVIRRSGENISAVEVESVLMQHPAVRQVAVAATPDTVRGDEVFACVVSEGPLPDAAARNRIAADIVAWSLSRLAYYKAPGYVAFVPAVPLTSTQKDPARRAEGAGRHDHRLRSCASIRGR